jgi:3-hydroxyisobutyrate dehydrogenase-like beta-hydroxyacid dehydrogenase
MGQIGFVGTGMMGSPMACNLVKAGFAVMVYDVRPEATRDCVALGAKPARIVSEMAVCEAVFVMVHSGPQVEEVLLGEQGLLKGMQPGQTLLAVIMSTISPHLIRKLAQTTAPKGLTLIDAPVSGGPILAQMGVLTFMIGGDEALADTVKPCLKAMGNNLFYIGPLGMGLAMKLVNNIVGITNAYVFTEAVKIGHAGGLDLKRAVEVINASSGRNWCSENWEMYCQFVGIVLKDASFSDTVIKDIKTAIDWAGELDLSSPILKAALAVVEAGVDVPEDLHRKMLATKV